jgi:hypothetical protein
VALSFDFHVDLLGAYIENRKGNLFTCVQHDENKQPFLLPKVTGHARLMHHHWYRFALIHVGHYCMTWEDFEDKRLRLERTFLANDYSLHFFGNNSINTTTKCVVKHASINGHILHFVANDFVV